MKTLILGAGFAGMAAGIKTGAPVFEATDHAGGICQDYEKEGFKFSNGGPHWIFGKDKGLDYIKTLVEVKEYERNAGIYYNNTFPYPFQETIKTPQSTIAGTFKYWLIDTFGLEKFNLFFGPFNEKYTAGLYDQIIPMDDYKSPRNGNGWVSTFCDPVGGLSTLVDKMSAQCHIEYNKQAISIDTHNKIVRFKDLWAIKYDKLISTIPLDQCLTMCGKKSNLPYTSVFVLNIGAERGSNVPKQHWLYIPFCNSGFHRVSFYTNVDSNKAPDGMVGLSVEYAFLPGTTINEEQLVFDIISELQSWGWIGKIITTQVDVVKCAYTWLYNKKDREEGIDWLKEHGIYSIGRYGNWKFCGLTQSIEMGMSI